MDLRRFHPLSCHYCEAAPRWAVHEDAYTPTHIYVCDEHKTLPYS